MRLRGVAQTAKGALIAIGRTRSDDGKHLEGLFVRARPGAKPLVEYEVVFGGGDHHRLTAISAVGDGTYLLAGTETVAGKNVAWQLRVDESGTASCK